MKTIYFQCGSGISGDMFVAAMLDLGVDARVLRQSLMGLGLGEFEIKITKSQKCGIACTDFDVVIKEEAGHVHRHLSDVEKIIDDSALSNFVKTLSKKIVAVVADAEGKVHGIDRSEVHFHEVGAADSIADIVGAAVCIEQIKPDRILFSPFVEGSGFVRCAHGILPVPAPATAEIMARAGIPFEVSEQMGEMVTPTGAAIAAAVSDGFGRMPRIALQKIGTGCGKKDFEKANILRAFLGETDERNGGADEIEVLETCIDDSTGEELGACVAALLEAGAADAYYTPIYMKKNRPAYLLTVLCESRLVDEIVGIVFRQTGSIGLRIRTAQRITMARDFREVPSAYGPIRVKISRYGDIVKMKPEFESVQRAAREYGVTAGEVTRSAIEQAGRPGC
ncbi:MAG TPA: nickel pincer cofactor biosynthesis protein LarC [Clostridia bacterium]|nr:nickel pincer cofactor biosynthesis protein LarC [Clostridia bacterium]